jgi:arylsulfatase A-like enzyme
VRVIEYFKDYRGSILKIIEGVIIMTKNPKNLIILCSDEMRGDCLGIMGNPDVLTPNLDEFGRNSVVFKNHFTCHGKCVPARVALMTGRYSHTDGYRDINNHMPENQPNLLGVLKGLGYQSAVFGKNHCWKTMFEGYVDYHSWKGKYGDYYNEKKAELDKSSENFKVKLDLEEGFHYLGGKDPFTDEVYTDQAIDYITETRDKSKPFFLQLNIEAPHPKYGVSEPYYSMYDREKIQHFPYTLPENPPLPLVKMREVRTGIEQRDEAYKEVQATYYGMISKVDYHMGRILQTIKDEGLLEDTVILFWVDHGDFAGQYGLVEKWDTCMNDCIMNTPCMLYAPNIPQGVAVESLTSHVDLAPTIMDIMGIEFIPGIHGKNLMAAIKGEGPVRKAVFADGGHEDEMIGRFNGSVINPKGKRDGKQDTYSKYPDTMARTKMVRTDKYKLVIRLRGGNELYDLEKDPYEMKNLWGISDYNNVVLELQQMMLEWCLETDTDRPHQPKVGA